MTTAVRRRHILVAFTGLLLACLGPGAVGLEQSSARWSQIRTTLFADREIRDGTGVIALDAPARAEDAAVVPVEIAADLTRTPERRIRTLYLIIDNNPSPVAAVIEFPGERRWRTLATRIRVNAYTDLRAVAELDDGELYMVSRFVKASGGCSAPALKDPAAAAAELGQMRLGLAERPDDGLLLARLAIRHPNSSGLQFDQITRSFIPADYVRTIEADYRGEPLFKATTDISISENPTVTLGLVADPGDGDLEVRVTDSKGRRFEKGLPAASVP